VNPPSTIKIKEGLGEMKKLFLIWLTIVCLLGCNVLLVLANESILVSYERGGIWKVDRTNHRCLVDPGVWAKIPFDKKEQILQVIYVEEKTWWELYDMNSGKLLGKVSSWGWKVYP